MDTGLAALNHTGRYGLIGVANSRGINGRTLLEGGSAEDFAAATSELVSSGSSEDGCAGLNHAFTTYDFALDGVRNFILITDEDRDNRNEDLTAPTMLASLRDQRALLNVVVNNPLSCVDGAAMGRTNTSGFRVAADAAFTRCTAPVTGNGAGTTETDYVSTRA